MVLVFFFKQKTAYEMRISDWSSDVCSSDLHRPALDRRRSHFWFSARFRHGDSVADCLGVGHLRDPHAACARYRVAGQTCRDAIGGRSEEHTSELQSLLRISYAVFCLKKKKQCKIQRQYEANKSQNTTRTN